MKKVIVNNDPELRYNSIDDRPVVRIEFFPYTIEYEYDEDKRRALPEDDPDYYLVNRHADANRQVITILSPTQARELLMELLDYFAKEATNG